LPAVFEHAGRLGSGEALSTDASEAGCGHALEADAVTCAAAQAFQNGAAQAIAIALRGR